MAHFLQAADYGGPYAGSFVPMLRSVAAHAASRGHQVSAVFTPVARDRPWLSELDDAGVAVSFAAGVDRASLRQAVAAGLPLGGPAVVHSHFTSFDLPALSVARARASRTAVLWHLHTTLSRRWPIRAANVLKFGVAGRRVDRIVAVAPHLAAGARRRFAPTRSTITLGNAVDLDRFDRRDPQRVARAREALGLSGARPVVVHFGRLWELKGGDLLLGAIALLDPASRPQVLTVAGPEAAAHARALGVGDVVRTLEPTLDVGTLYTAADIFVSSSRAEGMPYSLLEAAACGAGILATDIPGQAEIAAAIPGARLVRADPASLAAGLRELLKRTPAEAASDADASRAWIAAHADLDGAATALVALYENVIGA